MKLYDFRMKNNFREMRVLSVGNNFGKHAVLRVDLKKNGIWAIDLTHLQYGWPEVIMSWERYVARRVVEEAPGPMEHQMQRLDEINLEPRDAEELEEPTRFILTDQCSKSAAAVFSESIGESLRRKGRSFKDLLAVDDDQMEAFKDAILSKASAAAQRNVEEWQKEHKDSITRDNQRVEAKKRIAESATKKPEVESKNA